MAHKKGVGSTDNGRDSKSKRLGVKLFGGQFARAGNIIVRQRGTKFHAGDNTYLGKDFSLHAKVDGFVTFTRKRNNRTYISILPELAPVSETLDVAPKKAAPKAAPAPAPVAEKAAVVEKVVVAKEAAAPVAKAKKSAPKAEKAAEAVLSSEEKEAATKTLLSNIGEAAEADKDDLKKIKGVGPKLENVLNSIGIYTFSQVSKMTDAEYDIVDSLMDSFKGRGKRDDWAAQAKDLM